jgi:hypothetical protein
MAKLAKYLTAKDVAKMLMDALLEKAERDGANELAVMDHRPSHTQDGEFELQVGVGSPHFTVTVVGPWVPDAPSSGAGEPDWRDSETYFARQLPPWPVPGTSPRALSFSLRRPAEPPLPVVSLIAGRPSNVFFISRLLWIVDEIGETAAQGGAFFEKKSVAPIGVLTVQVEQVCEVKLGILAEQLTRCLYVLRRSAVLLQTGESWQRQ